MLYKWRSLSTTLSTRPLIAYSSKTHDFFGENSKAQKVSQENPDSQTKIATPLTPHLVNSTLSNCPSDLISLGFFLWCAKQPNYFHDRPAFDQMVNVLSRLTERFKTVRGIVQELERVGCRTKAQTFLLLLRIYWHGQMYEFVFEAFEQMDGYGFVPNTFARNVIVDALFKIGRKDVAFRVLRETQVPNFFSFNIALCNLCKLNDLDNVKYVTRIMLNNGYYPNAETLEMILNCFCKMGRLVEAYQVLGIMITLGYSTSVTAWSILINGFCRLGRVGKGSYLLEKMVETGCSPNVVTYTSLIKGFMENKMVSCAYNLLSFMESEGCTPDLVLCNVLIDCLSKRGRYDGALDVFGGFLERNLVPDSYTFCSLLSTICLSRRYWLLPKFHRELVINVDLVVCNSLLNYFCKAGCPSTALEFYNDMLDMGFTPDKYSFVGLLRALCKARRFNEAVNVYRGIAMSHSGLDAHVHTVVIGELVKVSKFHRAIGIFRKAVAQKFPLDVVSYTVAIHGLFSSGRTEEACMLYSQMKELGLVPNAHTYNVMISGFCKGRDVRMVKLMLQEMIEARIELSCNNFFRVNNLPYTSLYYRSVLNLLIEMRDLGLMRAKIMNEGFVTLQFDGPAQGVIVDDKRHLLLKGYLKSNILVDTSGSEDLSDVAASVG